MVTGGVRSGKSAYAEKLAKEYSAALSATAKVLYVATGMRSDGEMNTRIEAHRLRRPPAWDTLEVSEQLFSDSYNDYEIILLDTLSAWVSNQLIAVPEDQCRNPEVTVKIERQIGQFLEQLKRLDKLHTAIIVTDEVGWGGVVMSPLGRWFQDVIGEANQQLAASADEVVAVISGLPWRLKG